MASEVFDRLLAQKRREAHTVSHLSIDDVREHQITREDVVRRQLRDEKEHYERLAGTDGETIIVESMEQNRKLAPRIEEAGMSKKRREKVRNRTLNNLKEGQALVGEMATSQTVPLMRSIKKNAIKVAKEKAKEKTDIVALSRMELPADIFDVSLTEKHSHFDVKKAFAIKEDLAKIQKFKEDNNSEYEMLDLDVYVRLEHLLDMKDAFSDTLKVVLAANGLSENGEALAKDDEKIKQGRDDYYSYKDAYRETVEQTDQIIADKKTELIEHRKELFLGTGENYERKKAVRDELARTWEQRIEKDEDKEQYHIPKGFMDDQLFKRIVYRMNENDEEFSKKNFKLSIDVYKLSRTDILTDKERDEVFERVKAQAAPEYMEFRQKISAFMARLSKCSLGELAEMTPELISFEGPTQHFSDILKSKNTAGKSIKELLGISEEEDKRLSDYKTLLSHYRKRAVTVNAIRAAKTGAQFKLGQCDQSIQNMGARIMVIEADKKDASIKEEDRRLDMGKFINEFSQKFDDHKLVMASQITRIKISRRKASEERKAEAEHIKGMGTVIEEEKQQFAQETLGFFENLKETNFQTKYFKKKKSTKDLRPLFEEFKKSKMEGKNKVASGDPNDQAWADFQSMVRELLGTGEKITYSEGEIMFEVNEADATFDEVLALHMNPSEENIMGFLEPLLSFNTTAVINKLDYNTLKDVNKRMDIAAKLNAEQHPLVARKQWAEKFVMRGKLSEEATKKVRIAMDKFNKISGLINTLSLPGQTSITEFCEIDVPGWKNVLRCMEKDDELQDIAEQTKAELLQEHPLEQYTNEELRRLKLNSRNVTGLTGSVMEDTKPKMLPLSKEDAAKASSADEGFVKEHLQKIKSFSLVDGSGRARLLLGSEADEIATFGAQDLKYYSEMARSARLILISNDCDAAKTAEALGEEADKLLKDCRRIIALAEGLKAKCEDSGKLPSKMYEDYMESSGESYQDMVIMREDQLQAFDEAEKKMNFDKRRLGIDPEKFALHLKANPI